VDAASRTRNINAREVHVKKLPIWLVGILLLLGLVTTWIGWIDRHEVGYIPFVLGVIWVVFALAAAPRVFADD
jgi:hypothetical protein